MNVFDASALLAFLHGEAGADVVEEQLVHGPAACSAANWSETAQKILAKERNWPAASALLRDYDLEIVPVLTEDAERAAALWRPGAGLSLADRLCLATAQRLDAVVWTADAAWGESDRVRQVR